jgi:hypothetical protein
MEGLEENWGTNGLATADKFNPPSTYSSSSGMLRRTLLLLFRSPPLKLPMKDMRLISESASRVELAPS